MCPDTSLPRRHSIRLAHYDYSQHGAYFITICALNRECLFGQVVEGEMRLSEGGLIAEHEWVRSCEMRREVELDEFVIMPNHLHAIVFIVDAGGVRNADNGHQTAGGDIQGAGRPPDAPTVRATGMGTSRGVHRPGVHRPGVHRTPLQRPAGASLGALINGYKAAVTRSLTALGIVSGASVWQRNYYEHVVRNDQELEEIRRYIQE